MVGFVKTQSYVLLFVRFVYLLERRGGCPEKEREEDSEGGEREREYLPSAGSLSK